MAMRVFANESSKWRSGRASERVGVTGPCRRGGKTPHPFADDERVAAENDRDVMVPSRERASLEVVEPQFAHPRDGDPDDDRSRRARPRRTSCRSPTGTASSRGSSTHQGIELQARLAHPPEANLRRRPSRLRAMRGQAHRTRDGHGTGLRRQDARRAPPPARPARGRLIPIDRPRVTSRLGAAAPRAPHNPPRFQPPWKSAHPRTRPARSFPPFSAEIP